MRYIILLLSVCLSLPVIAQDIPSKAKKWFAEAKSELALRHTDKGIEILEKTLESYPDYGQAKITLGDIYFNNGDISKALSIYDTEGLELMDDFSLIPLFYRQGSAYFALGNYENAKRYLTNFTRAMGAEKRLMGEARHMLNSIDYAKELKANPVDFNPINLGSNVNSDGGEYMPSISADGKTLVFTKLVKINGREQEDFYYSELKNGNWTVANKLPGELNTLDNEGAQTLTADGYALFFTACNRRTGMGSCDLYISTKGPNGWSKPMNMGRPVNTGTWESQPSISSDGKTIYFTSSRPGGFGGKDIWKSTYIGGGEWSEPENLGPNVNTKRDEISPFIHLDNQTLYFASNGWPGMGNSDLFVTRLGEDNSWSEPQNLGYPINTYGDQSGLYIAADGKTAFYASNNSDAGFGSLDIFQFELPKSAEAIEVAYFKGRVKDAQSKVVISGAQIQVYDLNSNKVILESQSGKSGDFFFVLNANHDYAFIVNKSGYLDASENVSVEEDFKFGTAMERDVFLNPIQDGMVMPLENVFFDVNDFTIKDASFFELNKVVDFLNNNQSTNIEIGGHTDNTGDASLNLKLSENRAKAVLDYLVQQGVAASRMKYKGYGDTKPRMSNDTVQGRSKNRRTEIKIITK